MQEICIYDHIIIIQLNIVSLRNNVSSLSYFITWFLRLLIRSLKIMTQNVFFWKFFTIFQSFLIK